MLVPMFVVDLACAAGHLYEGWYDNAAAFEGARDGGELCCPTCGSGDVAQRPSFRGIATRGSTAPDKTPAPAPDAPRPAPDAQRPVPDATMPLEVQRALSRLLRAVRTHAEDVGDTFASRALAIHHGEEEARPIHGTSTAEEEQRLVDEGVPFAKIPVPDIDLN